jgi:hypothetical protein
MGITAAYTSGSQGLQLSPESPGSTSQVAEDVTNMYRTISGPTIFTSGFLGVTCIYRSKVYTAPSRPTVLVRPPKFPFILVQDLCYRSLKVLVIGIHIAKT